MNKFKIHYGGTSYVDTYDKNRYKLPHIYRFNPSKIKFYKGISKDEYNDVITFNDDTKFELGNIVPLIQITLLNIQNYYLHKESQLLQPQHSEDVWDPGCIRIAASVIAASLSSPGAQFP